MKDNSQILLREAQKRDREDPLRKYRNLFVIEDDDTIYLDGNSLGRLSKNTAQFLKHVIEEEWGNRLIRSWNERWMNRSLRIAEKIATLVGARPDEILIADSTSVNLSKLLAAAVKYAPERKKIITDSLNFPSDLYVLQGIAKHFGDGLSIRVVPGVNKIYANEERVIQELDEETLLLTLSLVSFTSAFLYDLKNISQHAREYNALTLWDLSHAVGVIPIDLNKSGVDMAVGCTYKYLNGGPGSPAFLYIRKELQQKLKQPFWGWFGCADPFTFNPEYIPASGIQQYASGTPYILSLSALEPGLDIIIEAGIKKIRKKSIQQTEYLMQLFDLWLNPLGYQLGSPREPEKRGSHVSICHKEAYRICQALINPNDGHLKVITDFRKPDNIRLGIAPLYTSFEDIYKALDRIRIVTDLKLYESFADVPIGVT